MKRLIAAGLALVAFNIAPDAAAARTTAAHRATYFHLYHQVAVKFGRRAPGRNIVRDGLSTGRAVTNSDVVKSIAVLRRMLVPPPAVRSSPTSTPAPATYAPTTSGSVPACASESGTNYSTGPSNTNPSSGATGRYQIIPSTAAAYGCDLATPAGQDACAQTIYNHQGAGAWVGCGG